MADTFSYVVYGMTVRSTFPLPFTPVPAEIALGAGAPAIEFRTAQVPTHLEDAEHANETWQCAPGRFLFAGGLRAARFLVETAGANGAPGLAFPQTSASREGMSSTQVSVHRNRLAEDARVDYHICHSVLAAIVRQRGLIALHASSAALTDGAAVAVTGESGAGKSTTAATLLGLPGWTLLGDDLTAVEVHGGRDDTRDVVVLPGVPVLSLSREAAAASGRDSDDFEPRAWQRMKGPVGAADKLALGSTRLKVVATLSIHDGPDLVVRRLRHTDKLATLIESLYGPVTPSQQVACFAEVAAIANAVEVVHIARPRGSWSASETAAIVARLVDDSDDSPALDGAARAAAG